MNIPRDVRSTPKGRGLLVQGIVIDGSRPRESTQAAGLSTPTTRKWLERYQPEGPAGLLDRSGQPSACFHASAVRS